MKKYKDKVLDPKQYKEMKIAKKLKKRGRKKKKN